MCSGQNATGPHALRHKTVLRDDGLAFSALGERHQCLGPRVVTNGRQVEKKPPRQRVILAGNQAGEWQHRLRCAVDYGYRPGLTDIRQTDKTNGLRVVTDSIRQLFAGFEALRGTAQGLPAAIEDQFFERLPGAGLIIAGI